MITATITGNLTKDPVTRATKSGKPMVSFCVASNTKSGDEKITTFVEVVAFDEQAESVANALRKGDRVMVAGRMDMETFQRKDGTEGQALRLLADDVGASLRFASKNAANAF